jgi:Trypsin-co-occurring domain 2
VEITDQGVPLGALIEAVKASVKRAGVSRTSPGRDLRIASVQLVLDAVASETAGGALEFCIPFIGMKLKLGAAVTKKDTHTIDITLIPQESTERQVRGGEDVEMVLVEAITAIRAVTSQAAQGDDPWTLSESTIDIAFAITQSGTISLGVDGELAHELTHTLRLRLKSAA